MISGFEVLRAASEISETIRRDVMVDAMDIRSLAKQMISALDVSEREGYSELSTEASIRSA